MSLTTSIINLCCSLCLISSFLISTLTPPLHCTLAPLQLNSTQLFPNTFFHKLSTWHLQVVAIKLNSSHLLDSSSDQQCVVRAKSYPSTSTTATESQKDMNLYSNDPSEAKRSDVQAAGKKVNDYLMLVCVWLVVTLVRWHGTLYVLQVCMFCACVYTLTQGDTGNDTYYNSQAAESRKYHHYVNMQG